LADQTERPVCPVWEEKIQNMKTDKMKGVIFDIDGVLLDSLSIWTDLGARYLKSKGREPEKGLAEKLFSMSMEQGAEYLAKEYSLGLDPGEVFDGLCDMLRDFYFYEVPAKTGSAKLIEGFKRDGLRITAATSSPREYVEKALSRNGLLDNFEKIFTSAETGSSKHSPKIYDDAASFMGTDPEETFVFEDSLYALKTAAAAGYITVGVFDAEGESDQEGMKETAYIYLESLEDWNS
jgi:HAD superfamily hydrolase (TIGR01509 family)